MYKPTYFLYATDNYTVIKSSNNTVYIHIIDFHMKAM